MKIVLFYDNFVRDYCGLLLLSEILKGYRHEVLLSPLWDNAEKLIDDQGPDVILMGHVAEHTTSRIAAHALKKGIRIVLNSTESGGNDEMMRDFFRCNFKESNENYMDFQVVTNRREYEYILNADEIHDKDKYKWIGFPRYDFHVNEHLRNVENELLRRKYKLDEYNRKFLYISSFIFDGSGEQVSPENRGDIDQSFKEKLDSIERRFTENILFKLIDTFNETNDVLMIKKHPWEKADIWEERIDGKNNVIILENDERITPVLGVADYMMHIRSITSFDAWCRGVKTISLFPDNEESRSLFFHHLNHEVVVSDYAGLVHAINDYPVPIPGQVYLDKYFEPYLDGKATIRLAREINKLEPGNTSSKSGGSGGAVIHKKNYDLSGVDRNSYTYNFILWETKRQEVDRLYLPAIQRYIQENISEFSDAEFSIDGSESEILLNGKGEELFLQGNTAEAREMFSRVIEMDGSFEPALNNKGVICCEEGDIENAVKYFSNALEINPFNRDAVLNISRVLISLGEAESTETLIGKYLSRNSKDREVSDLLRRPGSEGPAENKRARSGSTGDTEDHRLIIEDDDLSSVKVTALQSRYGRWEVVFRGLTIYCRDLLSFYMAAKDIFIQGIYDFDAAQEHPAVIDGGGHIGLFTLFIKQKYPGAIVTVFEPDRESVNLLEKNLDANGLRDVTVLNRGLFTRNGTVSFGSDHSDGSSIFAKEKETTVNVTRLSEYINSEIDFLKLNIEGAELDVIMEIEQKLPLVKEMVIEYHGFPEIGQNLHRILEVLDRAGFRYSIHDFDAETNPSSKPPFRINTESRIFLLIHAKKLYSPSGGPSQKTAGIGERRSNEPVSRVFGFDRGTPIDRYYIEEFLRKNRAAICGRVLEIADNTYTVKFGSEVTHIDVLNAVPSEHATIVGNLETGESIPDMLFDCIIMTQTLQCIYDIRAALNNAVRALKPGGTLLLTASGISQISRYDMDRWGEYWRFTDKSLRKVLSEVVPDGTVEVETYGNVSVAKAFLDGLSLEELPGDILNYNDKDYQMVLTAAVRKPDEKRTDNASFLQNSSAVSTSERPVILLYHRVADDPLDSQLLTVAPANFEAHLMELIKTCRVLPLRDLLKEVSEGLCIPGTVALTFDDGYADVLFHAVPLLEKYGVHATVFITSGMVGSEKEFWWDNLERVFLTGRTLPDTLEIIDEGDVHNWYLVTAEQRLRAHDEIANMLRTKPAHEITPFLDQLNGWAGIEQARRDTHRVVNPEQLKLLASSPSVDIGSHTVTHAWLSALSPEKQTEEIVQSKARIEELIQQRVHLFSYPFGSTASFTKASERIVHEAGYEAGIANIQGCMNGQLNLYSVPRRLVRNWSGSEFLEWIRDEDKERLERETRDGRERNLIDYQSRSKGCGQKEKKATKIKRTLTGKAS